MLFNFSTETEVFSVLLVLNLLSTKQLWVR